MIDEPELFYGSDVDAATFAAAFGESLDVALDLRTWHPGQDLAALYDRLAAEVAAAVEQENRLLPAFREQVFPRLVDRRGAPPGAGVHSVSPAEIESHLSTHPAVKLVQVVGAPDERLGEVVAAFVELAPGHEATAEELVEHCRGRIASFKVPQHVRFVDEWPMSATKIQKFRLREQIAAELASVAPPA